MARLLSLDVMRGIVMVLMAIDHVRVYYLLRIPVIHSAALVVSLLREGRLNPWLFGNHPMRPAARMAGSGISKPE